MCHWAGENRTKLGRGEARTFKETSLDTLRRHGNNRHSQTRAGQRTTAHDRALLSLREERSLEHDDKAEVGGASCFVEMPDAPSWGHIAHVWNTVKSGESFRSFERNILVSRATGAPIAGNRLSRKMCPKLLSAMAEELCSEDRMLLRRAQSIALTLDSRGRDIVCRVRMSLMELPAGVRPCHPSLCHEAQSDPGDSLQRPIAGLRGQEGAYVVNRLVSFWRKPANGCSDDAVATCRAIVVALKDMCGKEEELVEHVRKRVHCVCPDGAADVQLAARLCAVKHFPNLHWVFRCGAHAAQGAVEAAWSTDEKVAKVDCLICEVAKFMRSSPRFADRVCELAGLDEESKFAPVKNWSFAPHRFSSRAHPYGRFVLFVRAALEALGEEAERPTTAKRAK